MVYRKRFESKVTAVEIRQIKYFIEIVNYQSFSKASSALYVTQPALTKAIKLLEDELGFKLIDRGSNHFRLTDQGEIFYRSACDVYSSFQDLGNIVKDSGAGLCGKVNIEALVLASSFFRELVSHFAIHYPGIDIHIKENPSMEVLKNVQANLCDVGFVLMPVGNLGNCESSVICTEKMYPVLRRDHPLATKDCICVQDLADQGLILFNDDYQPHLDIMRLCFENGITPKVINSAPRINLLLHMAKYRNGVTFLPESYIEEYVTGDYPELVAKKFSHNIKREVAILYNKNRYLSRAVGLVLKFANEFFSSESGDFVRRKSGNS